MKAVKTGDSPSPGALHRTSGTLRCCLPWTLIIDSVPRDGHIGNLHLAHCKIPDSPQEGRKEGIPHKPYSLPMQLRDSDRAYQWGRRAPRWNLNSHTPVKGPLGAGQGLAVKPAKLTLFYTRPERTENGSTLKKKKKCSTQIFTAASSTTAPKQK